MQENDIYVVDTRNADHRTPQGVPWFRPNQPVRTMTAAPLSQVYSPPPAAAQHPQVIYAYPPQHSGAAHMFGKLGAGGMVDIVAQVFAALMPLPAKPTATGDAPTDVGNSLRYHEAIALHAKRDEQIRTLGNIVNKLVG